MNLLDVKTWSERQQILAVILLTGGLIMGLWRFVMYPGNKERLALENRISSQRSRLAQQGLLTDEATLRQRLRREEEYRDMLLDEWRETAERLGGFPNQRDLVEAPVSTIDFKVELYNARSDLERASRELGIRLPYDLGMEEAVSSNEDARKLMLQLRTARKMADLLLGLNVQKLGRIEPLEPVAHAVKDAGLDYIEEYPVRVEFFGSLENVYALFAAMLDKEHVFFLKNMRVESASLDTPGLLRVNANLGLLLFFKDPAELPPAQTVRAPRTATPRF